MNNMKKSQRTAYTWLETGDIPGGVTLCFSPHGHIPDMQVLELSWSEFVDNYRQDKDTESLAGVAEGLSNVLLST